MSNAIRPLSVPPSKPPSVKLQIYPSNQLLTYPQFTLPFCVTLLSLSLYLSRDPSSLSVSLSHFFSLSRLCVSFISSITASSSPPLQQLRPSLSLSPVRHTSPLAPMEKEVSLLKWYIRTYLLFEFGRKFKLRSREIRSLDLVAFGVCWSMGIGVSGGCIWSPETTGHGGRWRLAVRMYALWVWRKLLSLDLLFNDHL